MSENHFHSTFEMIQLSPIREQEKQQKAFEGASMEPTIRRVSCYSKNDSQICFFSKENTDVTLAAMASAPNFHC